MPGSIQVSVLDFKELPSSSSFVKVSLGKVEHEIGEKGTFSFPLTNLRDNLIITILDSEGNQVSHSGVRTISIIEKGTWDDLFPVEGGGIIHMKLEFILSDEERKRIRSMREYAMKKKQDEILNSRLRNAESAKSLASSLSRHEVSDVLRITSSQDFQRSGLNGDNAKDGFLTPLDDKFKKASESSDGIKEESFQRQSFTNATDRMEEASFSLVTEKMHQKVLAEDAKSRASQTDLAKNNKPIIPKSSSNMVEKLDEQNLEEKTPSYIKRKAEESTPTPLLQETEVNSDKHNETYSAKSKPSDDVAEKNLEETGVIYVKKTSKESKPPHSSQETKVNTIDEPKRLQDGSSSDVGSLRLVIAEKIKSFSPKLAGEEPDKQGPPEKTPRNIKKMISVFESSISQDRVPLKPMGTKAYRAGTVRLLKDHAVNTSETSSSTRLRNSFSTGDLRKNVSSITTKGEHAGFIENVMESSETNMQSKGTIGSEGDTLISGLKEKLLKDSTAVASIGMINEEKFALLETNAKKIVKSSEKGVDNEKKVAFVETNTKEIHESLEKGVKNEKKAAFTEMNTKEMQESSEKGVKNEKKVAFRETNTKEIKESSEKGIDNEKKAAFTETNKKEIQESSEKGVDNEKKAAFTETNTKEIQESSEKGVDNEKKAAFTEKNTKEIQESSEKGVDNEKKVALMETKTKEIQELSEKGVNNEKNVDFTGTNTKEIQESSEKGVDNEKKVAFIETNKSEMQESSEKVLNNEKKVAFIETSTKEMQESSEKGVNNEKKVAFIETSTKDMQESSEKGVKNEKKVAFIETNTIEILKSRQEDATVSGRMHEDDKESNIKQVETLSNKVTDGKKTSKDNLEYFYHDGSGPWIFPDEKRHFCMTAQKGHQEKTVASIPESIGQIEVHCESDGIVKQGEAMARISGNSSPKSSDEEDSTGSLGQAIKIALVVGFGVLVLLFRQREPPKDEKKGNNLVVKNQVFMNKRGSIGEHSRKISVLKL